MHQCSKGFEMDYVKMTPHFTLGSAVCHHCRSGGGAQLETMDSQEGCLYSLTPLRSRRNLDVCLHAFHAKRVMWNSGLGQGCTKPAPELWSQWCCLCTWVALGKSPNFRIWGGKGLLNRGSVLEYHVPDLPSARYFAHKFKEKRPKVWSVLIQGHFKLVRAV